MSRVGRAIAGLVFGYAVAWLGAFPALVGKSELLGSYVRWSWTGGGEIVTFVQAVGLLGAALGAIAGALLHRPRRPSP